MAEEKRNEVALAGEPLLGSSALEEAPASKASMFGFMSNVDILRQVTLILGLAICLAIAVFILLWGKEPEMRPLGEYSTQELVKTLDFLDQKQIN